MGGKLYKILLLISILGTSCAPRLNADAGPPVEFKQVAPDTLEIVSPLRYGGTERFRLLYTPNIRQLNIQSGLAGRIEEYLQLGSVLAARPVNVNVSGLCVSGCASVLFTQGQTKTFGPQGVVAFYSSLGGVNEQEFAQRLVRSGYTALEQRRYLEHWRQFGSLELHLLQNQGINPLLLRDSQRLIDQYQVEQGLNDLQGPPVLWTPSAQELTCYGVTDIVGENGGLNPETRAAIRQQSGIVLFDSGSVATRPPEVSSCVR